MFLPAVRSEAENTVPVKQPRRKEFHNISFFTTGLEEFDELNSLFGLTMESNYLVLARTKRQFGRKMFGQVAVI